VSQSNARTRVAASRSSSSSWFSATRRAAKVVGSAAAVHGVLERREPAGDGARAAVERPEELGRERALVGARDDEAPGEALDVPVEELRGRLDLEAASAARRRPAAGAGQGRLSSATSARSPRSGACAPLAR
jgi:hypothetical protein